MNKGKKAIRFVLLIASIFGIVFVVKTTLNIIETSEDTIFLGLDKGASDTLIIEDEQRFTLYLSELVVDGDPGYACDVQKDSSSDATKFVCSSYYKGHTIEFSIVVESDSNEYYFEDMGNTTLIVTNSVAIGKLTLPKGTYTIEIIDVLSNNYVNVAKIQNSAILGDVFKVIFGGIASIGAFVAVIVLSVMIKKAKKKESYKGDSYYQNNMNQLDRNKDVFNDDDPFAQFD